MQTITSQWPDAMPDQKRNAILQLIFANTECDEDRDRLLNFLESASNECDADEIIESLSNNRK